MGWGVHDYPEPPKELPWPRCPVCGEECEEYYLDDNKCVIGCENCVSTIDACEYLDANHC